MLRYMACMKDERVETSTVLSGPEAAVHEDQAEVIELVRQAVPLPFFFFFLSIQFSEGNFPLSQ